MSCLRLLRGAGVWCGFLFVSGFLAAPIMHGGFSFGRAGVWGVWYGVVV
jgi:hypothetical protein